MPFPPSARRLAHARQAGLTAARPVLVAGAAGAAVAIALGVASGWSAIGDALAAACTFGGGAGGDGGASGPRGAGGDGVAAAAGSDHAALATAVSHLTRTVLSVASSFFNAFSYTAL